MLITGFLELFMYDDRRMDRQVQWFLVVCFVSLVGASCARLTGWMGGTPKSGDCFYGVASWYGREFHGRKTANGERYNMYDHTAAHRTLPFGTVVLVTNLRNGRKTKVRINDRGPWIRGREIDLSYQAARDIGILNSGVEKVFIEVLSVR
jgi:rare lipoprotein A